MAPPRQRVPEGPLPIRPSRSCASAPSAAGCASRRAGTSSGRSSGRCDGPTCRWPSRLASAPQDQLRQRRIDRHGERGGVLRAAGDRAGGPRVGAGRARRGAASGIDIVQVVEWSRALADRLEASDWLVRVSGVPVNAVSEAVDRLLERETAEVTRMTKSAHGPSTCAARSSARVQRPVEAARDTGESRDPARLCDADGRTAHHTCRPPRRHSDRAA